ncbi:MAG: ABC transporter permease subunit [Erysipelotrichia bacterium]|nr:ABC transporter permease subunit [Erysipelotrichia bacterium]
MKTSISIIKKVLIVLFWLAIWQIGAMLINKPLLFASFFDCLKRFKGLLIDKNFYISVITTLSETLSGLIIATIMATILSYVAYKKALLKELINPLITVIKSIPVVCFAILLLIWQGNKLLSLFVSFTVIFPHIYFCCLSALENTDQKLLEGAKIYRLSSKDIFLYIYKENILISLVANMKSIISMAFKSIIAAEIIGLTAQSIGLQLYLCKISIDTAGLFCYTATIITLSYLTEKLILKLLDILGAHND